MSPFRTLRPPSAPRFRPGCEKLEDRSAPAVLSFEAPAGNGPDDILLRLRGNRIEIFLNDGTKAVVSRTAKSVDAVAILGAAGETDRLIVDYGAGGFFSQPVTFTGGAGGPDELAVVGTEADVSFTLAGTPTAASLASSGGGPIVLNGVERVELTGGGGDDRIDASAFSGETVQDGGAGNDTLVGGSGLDTLIGGPGDDTLITLTHGDDLLIGGQGKDRYVIDLGSIVTVIDAGGDDSLDFGGSDVAISATMGTFDGIVTDGDGNMALVDGTVETVIGTDGDDTFFDAGDVDFTFDGGLGDDVYFLDPGSTITVIDAGGDDSLNFSNSADTIAADLGEDSGTVTDSGGDMVFIIGMIEGVTGTAGDDFISGNSADNDLTGGAGNDTLTGGAGNDTYYEVPGSDDFIFDTGGIDTLDFSGALSAISIDLALSNGQLQTVDSAGNRVALFGDIENVVGSAFGDTLTGNSLNNLLSGGGGDDKLVGGPGNDVLVGGAGDDNLTGGSGRDVLIGGDGADRIVASSEEDIVIAGFTAHDGDTAALQAIAAKWGSGEEYPARVANLRSVLEGQGDTPTVFDDGDADTLTGAQHLDWFFVGVGDTITDQNRGEFVDPEFVG